MKDLVSIIIPVHNSSKYLRKCLNSILSQTYKNLEIITVENGSTDNSLEILKEYKGKIKIEVLKKGNIGLARNKGIDKSTGEYLVFIDSDDEINEYFIEKMLNKLKETKTDLVTCDMLNKYEIKNKEEIDTMYPSSTTSLKEIKKHLEDFNYGPINKLYKSKIIKGNNIKYPEGIKYEDVPFVLKYVLSSKNGISKVNEPLYYYLIHKESEQRTNDKRIFDIINIMDICLSFDVKEELTNLYVKILTTYSLKTRYITDKNVRFTFINNAYSKLKKNYPNWKKCNYITKRNIFKRIIIKHKLLVKIYTSIYNLIIVK